MARMCTVQHPHGRAAYHSFLQGQVGNPEVWFLRFQLQCTSVVVCVGCRGMVVTSMPSPVSRVVLARGGLLPHTVARARRILGPAIAVPSRACSRRSPPSYRVSAPLCQALVLMRAWFMGPAPAARTRAHLHLRFVLSRTRGGASRPTPGCRRPLPVCVPLPRGHASASLRRRTLRISRL